MTRVKLRQDPDGFLHVTVEADEYLSPGNAWQIARIHVDAKRQVIGGPVLSLRTLPVTQLAGGIEYHYAEQAEQENTDV